MVSLLILKQELAIEKFHLAMRHLLLPHLDKTSPIHIIGRIEFLHRLRTPLSIADQVIGERIVEFAFFHAPSVFHFVN